MLLSLRKGLTFFDDIFMMVARIALFIMMASISVDALGRYIFNSPLQGNYEFTSLYSMVIVVFLAMPGTYARGGHIRIDILRPILARIPGNPFERLNALLAGAVFGFMTWFTGIEAIGKFIDQDTTFGIVQFPLYWSYVWVPLGCGLLSIRLLLEVIVPQQKTMNDTGNIYS